MNAEIAITQRLILAAYAARVDYLRSKPRQFLLDLQHEAEDLRHTTTFSLRVAAEINFTACAMILEPADPALTFKTDQSTNQPK